ncbi:hypothetical protein ATK17_0314 [Branchiibius hedensis]|uniref:Peptidase n=1 Tax=Branchiibius hedensis TaxID=672460 RepID=A0A2Y9C0S6_9MICO|nr:hypothetical protein [Branchiibius hedensis]PWJ24226.1 hypothetical protein ATK17_0314 [Branchiibius hedensis]SSA33043.1 hypothetical protein SAMN04489750_0314 [Branchiibius hedensis]
MKRRTGAAALAAVAMSLTACGATITLPAIPTASVAATSSPTSSAGAAPSSATPSAAATSTDGSMRQGLPDEVVDRLTLSRVFLEVAEVKGLHYRISGRVVAVGNTSDSVLTTVTDAADESIPRIEALSGQHAKDKYLILAAADDSTAQKWTGDSNVADADGITMPYGKAAWIVIPTGHRFSDGGRVLDDDEYFTHVMDHEVFHADTLPVDFDDPSVPEWMVEGYAEWAANQEVSTGPEKEPPARLPSDTEVVDDTDDGYFRAGMFVQYLADRFGTSKALAYYRAMLVATHGSIAEEFHRATDADFTATVAAWQRQFHQQFVSFDPEWQWVSD